ncbi:hypothetical protein BC937DRAFT_89027 [Endogone sp. FLAS-F59071]|nr:hypothetical protein BC937DRAFT_89027 [Endogone sp. FLAS-F59071]|eukprot:RUS22462.1 hypothetical protein BC937DRAFT_89027 [Endogone sp. FLAS-F59071]
MLSSLLTITAVVGLTATSASAQDTAPYYPNNWAWKNASIYPPLFDSKGAWAKAPTNTSLVQQWMKLIDWTKVPNITVNKIDKNGNLINPYPNNQNPTCDWSFDGNCTRSTDVVQCPQKGVWGLVSIMFYSSSMNSKEICLIIYCYRSQNFDDGPTKAGIQLYDYLKSINQKASLFYIGLMVAQYPAHAKRACDDGHHIALHTWSHQVLTTLTNEEIVAELKYTEMIIKEVCGITPRYMRPPTGDIDDRVRSIATQLVRKICTFHVRLSNININLFTYFSGPKGYTPIMWDLDTNDWMHSLPSGPTAQQEDGNFTLWTSSQYTTANHGHIALQHELDNFTVGEAIKNIPKLKQAYNVMSIASCIGESHPYQENIMYPVIQPDGSLSNSGNLVNGTAAPSSVALTFSTISRTNAVTTAAAAAATSVSVNVASVAQSKSAATDRTSLISGTFGAMVGIIALLANIF